MTIIKYLSSTEKSIRLLESENKLVFIVDRRSRKPEIKAEIENMFNVKITKINTMIDRKGNKKAIVALSEETPAIDIATNLGLM